MTEKEIKMYLGCKKCYEEKLRDNFSVGQTDKGLQVWCETHDINVMHYEIEGMELVKCACCETDLKGEIE